MEWWSLQLCQQGSDLLLRNMVEDSFHASQPACGGFQHVEDLLVLETHQVRLVGMAVLAKHLTVELDAEVRQKKGRPDSQCFKPRGDLREAINSSQRFAWRAHRRLWLVRESNGLG